MTFSRVFTALVSAAILSISPLVLRAQNADLPAAPSAPAKPDFHLPPGSAVTVAAPTGMPPPAPDVDTDDCYAAAVGIYAKQKPLPKPVQLEVDRYRFLITAQIEKEWTHHMPRATKDPWLKGKMLAVRFAIMPDGSINEPTITMHSGRESYDKHAVDSIVAASPFAPLPDGVGHPLPMCFRFMYNLTPTDKKSAPIDLWPPPAKPKASGDADPASTAKPQ